MYHFPRKFRRVRQVYKKLPLVGQAIAVRGLSNALKTHLGPSLNSAACAATHCSNHYLGFFPGSSVPEVFIRRRHFHLSLHRHPGSRGGRKFLRSSDAFRIRRYPSAVRLRRSHTAQKATPAGQRQGCARKTWCSVHVILEGLHLQALGVLQATSIERLLVDSQSWRESEHPQPCGVIRLGKPQHQSGIVKKKYLRQVKDLEPRYRSLWFRASALQNQSKENGRALVSTNETGQRPLQGPPGPCETHVTPLTSLSGGCIVPKYRN